MELTANEARVMGCLLEKAVITPDQYPLTLNALTNACNQKSSRDPVMSLEPGVVQQTVRALEGKHLIRTEENFRNQTEKYTQRLCNTPFSDYQFEPPQYAIVCVLLLRGPRTPGELRANSGRLHTFEDNEAVVEALEPLLAEGVVSQLPRQPGRRDSEYMHLLSGELSGVLSRELTAPAQPRSIEPPAPDTNADAVSTENAGQVDGGDRDDSLGALTRRVAALEAELDRLRTLIEDNPAPKSEGPGDPG